MSDDSKRSGGGLSVQTLLISSISAVAATIIVSQFWESGTLLFTAMVPIVVALVSEALKRPAEKITQVAPLVVPTRRTATGTAVYDEAPGERPVPDEARRSLPDREDRFGLYEPQRPAAGRRWLKVGLVTGLIAFLIGATAVTASELAIFGGSVGGGDRRTTYFGGKEVRERPARDERPQEEATPAAAPDEEATPTPAPEEEEATPTPAPEEEATPAPTATPTPPPATTPPPAEEDPAAP